MTKLTKILPLETHHAAIYTSAVPVVNADTRSLPQDAQNRRHRRTSPATPSPQEVATRRVVNAIGYHPRPPGGSKK